MALPSSTAAFVLVLTATGIATTRQDAATGKLVFSFVKVFYALFLVTLISSCLYFQVSTYLELRIDNSLMQGILYLYPMIADSIMSVLIIISSLYSTHIFMNFMNNHENKFILQSLAEYFDKGSAIWQISISALIFFGPYFLDIFYYHPSIEAKNPIYQGVSYIFVLYNYVALNEFALVLTAVKRMYESINEEVKSLCGCGEEMESSAYEETGSFRKVARHQQSNFAKFQTELFARRLVEGPEKTEEMHRVRGQHHKMFKMCRAVNSMFALTNMGLIVHHGVLGVIQSYWGLRQALSQHRTNDVGELVNAFRSAALSFLSIAWLVVPTTGVAAEVEKTGRLIQKSLIVAENKDFHSEVKTFSLQLTLEDVTFSPYEFFQLGNELLLSMLSAISSYMIILLQYQIMLDEQGQPVGATASH